MLFNRHEFHPAFRTIPRIVAYDFGMHRAGVLLDLLMLVLLLLVGLVLTMGVLCDQRVSKR